MLSFELAYMLYFSHDFHFHVNFLIEDSILHKSSLLELFSSVGHSIKFGCDLVNNGEGTFTNAADLVVFITTTPFLNPFSQS